MTTFNNTTAVSDAELELKRNFAFCRGPMNPVFDPANFDNKTEETVFLNGVSLHLEPIVMQPRDGKPKIGSRWCARRGSWDSNGD